MSETIGRLLAAGNVAEVFEWGSRVVKLYRSPARKPTAFCRSYLLLKLHAEDIAEPYLDAYCRITNMPRAKILDWLPYVAAARLAEDVPDDWARLLEIVHA